MAIADYEPDTAIHQSDVGYDYCGFATAWIVKYPESRRILEATGAGVSLHDIGKLETPKQIILKPGSLTPAEREIMQLHSVSGKNMFFDTNILKKFAEIPHSHHEKWDGTGYPRGLKGTAIPLAARLFAIIDQWHALTHDRPYRPAMTIAAATAIIHGNSGTFFNPEVVVMFFKHFAF